MNNLVSTSSKLLCLMLLVITLLPNTLQAKGQEIGNGGQRLRILFEEGRQLALKRLSRPAASGYSRAPEKDWLEKNRELLIKDVRKSKFEWELELPDYCPLEACACTKTKSKDAIILSLKRCSESNPSVEEAAKLIVHESAHHLGIRDESQADRIAIRAIAKIIEQERAPLIKTSFGDEDEVFILGVFGEVGRKQVDIAGDEAYVGPGLSLGIPAGTFFRANIVYSYASYRVSYDFDYDENGQTLNDSVSGILASHKIGLELEYVDEKLTAVPRFLKNFMFRAGTAPFLSAAIGMILTQYDVDIETTSDAETEHKSDAGISRWIYVQPSVGLTTKILSQLDLVFGVGAVIPLTGLSPEDPYVTGQYGPIISLGLDYSL